MPQPRMTVAQARGVRSEHLAEVMMADKSPYALFQGAPDMPLTKISFPSIVVASENDAFVSLNRAKYFAEKWGSDFVNIGYKGHINSGSNLKFWEDGQEILERLIGED